MPLTIRRLYAPKTIQRQAYVFDEFLYRMTESIVDYQNIYTLERRVIGLANRMREIKNGRLFVCFDLRL